jgi:hypothetical protein
MAVPATALLQRSSESPGLLFFVVWIGLTIIVLAGIWKTFVKAGAPGWASIVPFYNTYVLVKMSGRPGWWFWLLLIPLVNLAIWVIVSIDIAERFGKGAGFGLGLAFLGIIFFPILGFSDATYAA